ncbi:hypothetical protein [Apilactobacillus bombintestini]|uniref:Lipoprotein n=1 Tax=Apilactobacillus bombintestini TaxID=2419772 RepID=A0A387AQ85_9LACO|nr:hypothetical protein [Apilactobacillus bombintestini]AYF92077.1 hypothetical protein D7I45_00525 [Apilactobacillus bombintestini]
MKSWKKVVPAVVVLGLALTACGQKNNDNSNSQSSSEQTTASTSSSVQSSSKSSSTSSMKKTNKLGKEKLPQDNGMEASSSVNTKVDGNKDNYTINYSNNNAIYATFTKHTYSSSAAAMQQVGYQSAANVAGLPTTSLGYGVKGVADHGAGQVYIQANFGNWSLLTHGSNFGKQKGFATKQAKNVISFIQNHNLPIPNKAGSIRVEINNTTTITWQEGTVVYSVKANNANIALKMVTSLK